MTAVVGMPVVFYLNDTFSCVLNLEVVILNLGLFLYNEKCLPLPH